MSANKNAHLALHTENDKIKEKKVERKTKLVIKIRQTMPDKTERHLPLYQQFFFSAFSCISYDQYHEMKKLKMVGGRGDKIQDNGGSSGYITLDQKFAKVRNSEIITLNNSNYY